MSIERANQNRGELLTWEHADVVLQLTQRGIAMEHTEWSKQSRVGGSNPSAPTAVELSHLISSQVAPSQCGGDYHPNLIGDKKKSHDSGSLEG